MNRVRELRLRGGMQQKEVAVAAGVSRPTVSEWEHQKKDPSGERLMALAKLFDVSTGVILCMDAVPEPNAGTASPEIQMTEAEYALSMRWRKLSDKGKRDVMNFIQYTETMEQDGNEEE